MSVDLAEYHDNPLTQSSYLTHISESEITSIARSIANLISSSHVHFRETKVEVASKALPKILIQVVEKVTVHRRVASVVAVLP